MYQINIIIRNKHGDILDTERSFDTLGDMASTLDMGELINEAYDYAQENLMLLEELYDSKKEAELAIEDKN